MNPPKSHFRFNKQERSGIFFLLAIIVVLQLGYTCFLLFPPDAGPSALVVDNELQQQIDSLKKITSKEAAIKKYPFNPNFITDYKGYVLGMSPGEIDRLHAFREAGKFANTAEDFQKVTGVSDSLLAVLSPYFKFPEWTKKKRTSEKHYRKSRTKSEIPAVKSNSSYTVYTKGSQARTPNTAKGSTASGEALRDLNSATVADLRTINGIGEKLSARILKFRDRLGGFLVAEQLYDVYGLDPEVAALALRKFTIVERPGIQKININTASTYEIASLLYIQGKIAERIVAYRDSIGAIKSFDELKNIEGFPTEKIPRIALYLSL